jgi:hypothetical protein
MPVAQKTPCAVTRQEFRDNAKRIAVSIAGKNFDVDPKEFSTGSLGWNLNDKLTVEIGGKRVTCQVGLNLTLVNSKELPQS